MNLIYTEDINENEIKKIISDLMHITYKYNNIFSDLMHITYKCNNIFPKTSFF
jgi:hypothetical protein